jgi:hypothetical protein
MGFLAGDDVSDRFILRPAQFFGAGLFPVEAGKQFSKLSRTNQTADVIDTNLV